MPPILLLDEPLSSLDPLARQEFLSVLSDAVKAAGTTVVISSHVVSDVERACDRLIVLGVGRKLLDDSIVSATATHRTVDHLTAQRMVSDIVGEIGDHPAGPRWLVRWHDETGGDAFDSAAPTLEEVVLGYLRAGVTVTESDR